MIRFNYLQRSQRTSGQWSFPTLALDNRIRGPLAALLGTIFLTATLSVIQLERFYAAQAIYCAAALRVSLQAADLDSVAATQTRLQSKLQLIGLLATFHRANVLHANNLAWIGNHLPAQTWLDVLRYEAGSYSLEGTSEHAAAVATALLAFRDDQHAMTPQLISLQDDQTAGTPRVRYHLRLLTSR